MELTFLASPFGVVLFSLSVFLNLLCQPLPSRDLIGDEEKQRYATLLEWNGNPPPQVLPEDFEYIPKKARGRKTEVGNAHANVDGYFFVFFSKKFRPI